MPKWLQQNYLVLIGIVLVIVFVFGGLATNDPASGGYRDIPPGEGSGHYKVGDKKFERR